MIPLTPDYVEELTNIALARELWQPDRNEQRAAVETIFYAAPNWKPIRELFASNPAYPKLKDHIALGTGKKVYHTRQEVEKEFGFLDVADWSIKTTFLRFRRGGCFTGSSLLAHQFAPRRDFGEYVAICPASTWGKWPGRGFDVQDWVACVAFLEAHDLRGVVIGEDEAGIPSSERIIDLRRQTGILDSLEVVKGASGYLGVDTCWSVLAAQLFPAERLCIKATESAQAGNLGNNSATYYAPHHVFSFVRNRIEGPKWK